VQADAHAEQRLEAVIRLAAHARQIEIGIPLHDAGLCVQIY
jgi:hypothetical protein